MHLDRSGPDSDGESLQRILTLLRLSRHDPVVFLRVKETLVRLSGATHTCFAAEHAELRRALRRVLANAFHMRGQHDDVAFEVGRCLYQLCRPEEALACYRTSLENFGDHHITLFNVALCEKELGRRAAALAAIDRVLQMSPGYARATKLRAEVAGERTAAGAEDEG